MIFKKFPQGNLTVLFSAVAVISIIALLWMGVRLGRQDRALETQRLEELREQAADQFVAGLEEALQAEQTRLVNNPITEFHATTDDTVLLIAGAGELKVLPERSLLFYPVTFNARTASPQLFARAERSEFVDRNYDRAIESLRTLLKAEDPAVRAGAKLRLARNLRKAGQREAALEVYDELASAIDPEVFVSGVPVDLVARLARCRLLEELDKQDQLKEEANQIHQGLEMVRWHLDRPSYFYYSEQVERWTKNESAAATCRKALAESAAWVWNEWRDTRDSPLEIDGRRCLNVNGMYILVLSQSSSERVTSLILGPRYQFTQWFNPSLQRSEFTGLQVSLENSEEVWVVGEEPREDNPGTLRAASITGLPWDIFLTGAAFEAELSQFVQRRQMVMAGLGILVLFLIASSYLINRGVTRELAAAQLQSDFVSAVSHEFRTPLTSIRQFTEMLLEDDNLPADKRQKFYRAQERSTRRLSRLVESLLDFGRMEAGARPYRFEPFDAGQLVRSVVEEFRAESACNDFVVEYTVPDESIKINGDREALAQALWNLLDNAVKYSGTSRKVEVELEIGSEIKIHVRDQGFGIQTFENEQIFCKFTRGSSAKTLGIKGTGIGLAMVKHIVDAHGGRVVIDSRAGKGSTFYSPLAGWRLS